MLFNLSRRQAVFPFDGAHLSHIARKWGINQADLTEAIMATGSLKRSEIRDYLAKKGRVFSISGLLFHTKRRYRNLLMKFRDED